MAQDQSPPAEKCGEYRIEFRLCRRHSTVKEESLCMLLKQLSNYSTSQYQRSLSNGSFPNLFQRSTSAATQRTALCRRGQLPERSIFLTAEHDLLYFASLGVPGHCLSLPSNNCTSDCVLGTVPFCSSVLATVSSSTGMLTRRDCIGLMIHLASLIFRAVARRMKSKAGRISIRKARELVAMLVRIAGNHASDR